MNIFTYPALTEECILRSSGVFPNGEYKYKVLDAEFSISKTSNIPMVILTLLITNPMGLTITLKDYLMGEGKTLYRLKHFWESANAYEMLLNGNARKEDFKGREGKLALLAIIDPVYGAKNKVKDYIPTDKKEFIEDEKLPF